MIRPELLVAFGMLALLLCWFTLGAVHLDPASKEALLQLERRLHILASHLNQNHPQDPRVLSITKRWDGRLKQLTEHGAGSTTNKRAISVCVRDSSGRLQDPMTACFVCIHELSHVCTESEGHTDEFWTNFRFLLKEAVAAGIYQYQHFEKAPVTFCGSSIAHSPLTCLKDGSC